MNIKSHFHDQGIPKIDTENRNRKLTKPAQGGVGESSAFVADGQED